MDAFDTVDTLPDGSLPKLRVKGKSILDNGHITSDGSGNLTAASFHGPVVLPTTDPHVVNALWNHAGVLTISAG